MKQKQSAGFLSMLLGILGASLFWILLTDIGVKAKIVISGREEAIRAAHNF